MKLTLTVIVFALLVHSCHKEKPNRVAQIPGDQTSRDFYNLNQIGSPCLILIPRGASINFMNRIVIHPEKDGLVDDPPAPIQIYNCHFEEPSK
jgi:hypothetical protein